MERHFARIAIAKGVGFDFYFLHSQSMSTYKVSYWEETGRVSTIEAKNEQEAKDKAMEMLQEETAPNKDITHHDEYIIDVE